MHFARAGNTHQQRTQTASTSWNPAGSKSQRHNSQSARSAAQWRRTHRAYTLWTATCRSSCKSFPSGLRSRPCCRQDNMSRADRWSLRRCRSGKTCHFRTNTGSELLSPRHSKTRRCTHQTRRSDPSCCRRRPHRTRSARSCRSTCNSVPWAILSCWSSAPDNTSGFGRASATPTSTRQGSRSQRYSRPTRP